jgi:hypothetical protein
MRDSINGNAFVRGRVRASKVVDSIWTPATAWKHNDVLYSWGAIAARMLAQVGVNYRINGILFEYKNVADPSDTVSPPAFDRTGGINYYDGLSSSPDVDYLRVPIIASTLDSSDPTLFPDVNRMTFFAMSQGATGVNGKPFGPTHNSLVYGGALVSIVDLADKTQDIVFSRYYLEPDDQMLAMASASLGLEWQLSLT